MKLLKQKNCGHICRKANVTECSLCGKWQGKLVDKLRKHIRNLRKRGFESRAIDLEIVLGDDVHESAG